MNPFKLLFMVSTFGIAACIFLYSVLFVKGILILGADHATLSPFAVVGFAVIGITSTIGILRRKYAWLYLISAGTIFALYFAGVMN